MSIQRKAAQQVAEVQRENERIRKLMGMTRLADPKTGKPIQLSLPQSRCSQRSSRNTADVSTSSGKKHPRSDNATPEEAQEEQGTHEQQQQQEQEQDGGVVVVVDGEKKKDVRCATRPSFFIDMVRHHPGLTNPQWSVLQIQEINKKYAAAAQRQAQREQEGQPTMTTSTHTEGLLKIPSIAASAAPQHFTLPGYMQGSKISPPPQQQQQPRKEINAWATRLRPNVWLPPTTNKQQIRMSVHHCPFNTTMDDDSVAAPGVSVVVTQVASAARQQRGGGGL